MIFKSPYPNIAIPDVPVTSFILEHAARFGARPALIDGRTGWTLTYDQLAAAIDRTAAGLFAHGFRKGDVFAIRCANAPEYAIAFLAVANLGGIATMVSPLFNEAELSVQLKDSGASYLLTDSELVETALAAARAVTLPRFDLEEFLGVLQNYEINIVPVVPPIVLALAQTPLVDRFDLSKLETLHCGAAPLSVEVARAACERLGARISYGYGMTELSPLSHLTYDAGNENKPASAGYCLPNTTCKIVGVETRIELGPGEEGEVCVRGPQVMKGYLGQPEATAELIDDEGWLRTGDIGYADEDGALFIVDRLK